MTDQSKEWQIMMKKENEAWDCCENGPAFETDLAPMKETNSRIINFAALSEEQQQAFADFQLKEKHRHLHDIENIDKDLAIMKQHYGIEPQGVFINTWLEVKPEKVKK